MKAARRMGLLVVAVVGCNPAFGLQETVLRDAPPDTPPDVNCATVTPDEDKDCVADDADNCPGLANTAQFDLDGDGVGDECDPRQGRVGDFILQFDSFNDPSLSQQHWRDEETTNPTQFMFEQGYVRHTSITDGFSVLQSVTPIAHEEVTVELGFDLVGWDSTVYPHVSVISDAKLNDTNGNHCQLEDDDSTGPPTPQISLFMREWDVNAANPAGDGATTQTNVYPAMERPLPLVMTFRRSTSDGELECELRYGFRRGSAGTIVRSPTAAWPDDRYISIYMKNAAVDIKWITLYAVR